MHVHQWRDGKLRDGVEPRRPLRDGQHDVRQWRMGPVQRQASERYLRSGERQQLRRQGEQSPGRLRLYQRREHYMRQRARRARLVWSGPDDVHWWCVGDVQHSAGGTRYVRRRE